MDNSKLKVLVVDDNDINRKLMVMYLAKINIHADAAVNGQEAVKLCAENFYNLVFMDVYMPLMDGVSAAREINLLLGKDAPVIIAVTANAFSEDRESCIDAGMKDFLTKPITKDGLLSIVEQFFPA